MFDQKLITEWLLIAFIVNFSAMTLCGYGILSSLLSNPDRWDSLNPELEKVALYLEASSSIWSILFFSREVTPGYSLIIWRSMQVS